MKLVLFAICLIFLVYPVSATILTYDDWNVANNDGVGINYTEQHASYYDTYNQTLRGALGGATVAVINNNISLSQNNYNLSFTYIDHNASITNSRVYTSLYLQSYTTKSTGGYTIRLYEDQNYIVYYYANETYISSSSTAVNLINGTQYIFSTINNNSLVDIYTYQNNILIDTKIGLSGYYNGTVGFTFVDSENAAVDNVKIETITDATPLITYSSPSSPTTSFVNESKTFNAGSDQSGNWTWYIDSVLKKDSETNTANGTYTNSTAPNGTVYNITAIITNANGSAQTSWNWTPLMNYITSNVTYSDGTNSTIVHIVNVSYVSPGITQWGFNFSWTDDGQQYDWTYTNSTIIQSLTASSTNETLEFMKAPPSPTGIYYIQKASAVTIETFAVAVGAFAAVVVAGAAVVSRRVRRSIGRFINQRIGRW